MSTSKIGRAIKPRDVVTPGHSDRKNKDTLESVREELQRVNKVCEVLQDKYKKQSDKLAKLIGKFEDLEKSHQQKKRELVIVKEELESKKEQLDFINSHVTELEDKLTRLAAECEELRKTFAERQNEKPEKKSGWKVF